MLKPRFPVSSAVPSSGLSASTSDPASSATSYADPHAVSIEEANSYYAGLNSRPTLLYRTGGKWSPPQGSEKRLIPAGTTQMERAWNEGDLGMETVKVMDNHKVIFSSLNVVRFKTVNVDGTDDISPVTIYIVVAPRSTMPTAAHNAAKDVQGLLTKHGITDVVNIEFAE